MTLRNQVLVWGGFTIFVIFAIWLFRPILLPFVIGMALAYLLNPVVNLVQRARIPRAWATAIVLLFIIALIVGLFLMLMPVAIKQIGDLVQRLPGYITQLQELAQGLAPQLNEWLGPERAAQLEQSLSQLIGTAVEFIGNLTGQIAQSGLTVLNTIAVLIITPVVAFYLLLDWDGIARKIDDLLPRQYRTEIRGVLDQIDRSMSGVIRGQGSVILVLCIYYATSLSLVGLSFGLVIGLITGLLSFIPFVGFLIGFVLSMGIALVQFAPNWFYVVIVAVVFAVGQFLEGNVLYPRLVGQSININPVWLMFALFAFAFLFGFVGLLLAVPLAAITAVLTRYALKRYQESSLYTGPAPLAAADPVVEPPPPPPKTPARKVAAKK